jgi:hypothetical protein
MDIASNAVTNIISAAALAVSLVVGFFYFRDRRHAKFAIESEYVSRLLLWHGDVVEVLISLKCSVSDGNKEPRLNSLCKLSALIEQGRFFFPNIKANGNFGKEKPPAYRGYRNLALDMLVASYNLHQKADAASHIRQAETLQRHFTSIVFAVVRPENRLEEIRKITDKYFAPEKSFEDFLDHADPSAIEFIWDKV